ncbi:Hypothetical protein CINCED_3A002368, partial [Cinara cedri]
SYNAFVPANIPLQKQGNHVLKSFLEKYIGKSILDESTLRKNYIPNIYKSIMDQIISDIGNNYDNIIDQTTDSRRKKAFLKAPMRINTEKKCQVHLYYPNLLVDRKPEPEPEPLNKIIKYQ